MDRQLAQVIQEVQSIAQEANPKSPGAFLLGVAILELASEHVMPHQMYEMVKAALAELMGSMEEPVRSAGPSRRHEPEPLDVPVVVPLPKPRFRVRINYFKPSGKWYAEGTYESEADYYHDLVAEVQQMFAENRCPGLADGPLKFYAHVLAEGAHNEVPFLVRPCIQG